MKHGQGAEARAQQLPTREELARRTNAEAKAKAKAKAKADAAALEAKASAAACLAADARAGVRRVDLRMA